METITRGGRAVQGFALGEVGRGGGGHPGGGGGRSFAHPAHGGVPERWGWWGNPYDPSAVITGPADCTQWGAPITLPPGMYMAARMALGQSGFQPTVAQGPDGVTYRFSVENSEIVVRPCASPVGVSGSLGEAISAGLSGVGVSVSPAFASIAAGAAVGLLAHVLKAPFWGSILAGAGTALVTNVSIDRAA